MSATDHTPAYQADEDPAPTAPPAPPPLAAEPDGEDNRGHRAAVTQAGEVIGSGASAGGDGNAEDIDSDTAGGSDRAALPKADHPDNGGDGRKHGSA